MTHILPPQKPGQRSNGPSPTARSSREAAGRVPGSLAAARAPRSVPSSNATYGVSSGVKAHPTTLVKQASRAEAAVADETLADDLSEPADAADVVESNRDADSDDAEVDAAPLSEFALPPSLAETYRLKGPVGSGAFGTVWRATHIDSGLEVAIKVIERKKQLVEDFRLELNEAEILKALNHPNIVRLTELAADPSGTAAYLIMELVNGGHLQAQLDEHGAYADADASEIFRQMANAIAYLHERNITHRDIKPENILFTQPGALTVKLTDFGMSTMKGGRLTTRCGTPSYCAPELLAGDGYGKAVDMWSLGVLAYALVYAELPFVAQTRDELFEQIRRGSFELPAAAKDGREVSEKAKDLIARLLKSDPMQRYTTRETLQHPWVTGADDFAGSFNSLDTVHEMMRRFNAERRWRRTLTAVSTCVFLQRSHAARKGLPWPPASYNWPDDVEVDAVAQETAALSAKATSRAVPVAVQRKGSSSTSGAAASRTAVGKR